MSNDLTITFGGEVKNLSGGKNRAGGYGILFTDVLSPDTTNEYFTAETAFWLEDRKTVPVLYSHALDKAIGKQRLGDATFKQDETGVWFEFQLDQRNKYVAKIMELIKKGVLGFSTGAWGNLIERVEVAKGLATWIKQWPVFELSLTPTPAEPRTQAIELKHYHSIGLDEMHRRSKLTEGQLLREEGERIAQKAQDVLTGRHREIENWADDQLRQRGRNRERVLTLEELKLKGSQLDALMKEAEDLNKQMRQKIERDRNAERYRPNYEWVKNGHLIGRGRY